MPSFKIIGILVLEKIFQVVFFYIYMYGHGSHLGHVTLTIYICFCSPFPRRLHINLAVIGQVVSEYMFENNSHIHVYSLGPGADNPLGSKFFH